MEGGHNRNRLEIAVDRLSANYNNCSVVHILHCTAILSNICALYATCYYFSLRNHAIQQNTFLTPLLLGAGSTKSGYCVCGFSSG